MSSPAAAPTPGTQPSAGKEPSKAPPRSAANGTNPSTPAAHPTPSSMGQINFLSPTAGRVAGKTLGKTLAGHHSSPAVSSGTPTLNNLASTFDSPAFVGMEPGSSSMGFSMSGLGLGMGLSTSALGASSMGKLDDAERRRRLEAVLTALSKRTGRVSQEGLERLARKHGMDMYMETSREERVMTIASGAYAIDITFRPKTSSKVSHLALQFHGLCDPVSDRAPEAANILRRDLEPPRGQPTLNSMLDRFADNLERLARMDRLSVTGANCFEAIAGVHASLTRLYEHDKSMVKSLQEPASCDIDTEVMCKKNGRPTMHARSRVGLSLEYWRDQHLVPKTNADDSRMDIDGEATEDGDELHSLTLECEHCPPALYQTIRVSNDWLSPQITKSADAMGDSSGLMQDELDWTEPAPPLISGTEPDQMSASAAVQSAHPHARFVARLEPTVVLPFNVAAPVLASVGIDITQEIPQIQAQQQTYDGLLLGRDRNTSHTRKVSSFDKDGTEHDEEWETNLHISRPDFGRSLTSIPFAHPRQVLPILPVLRQYTLFARLLRSICPPDDARKAGTRTKARANGTAKSSRAVRTELEDLLSMELNGTAPTRVLDVTLVQSSPVPRLSVTLSARGALRGYSVEVLSNGELSVASEEALFGLDIADGDDGTGKDGASSSDADADAKRRAWTRALAACEDLAVWAEWMLAQP